MEEEPISPAPPVIKPDKGSNSKLAWVVAVVMTLVAGSFGYLYFTQDEAPVPAPAEQTQDTSQTEEPTKTVYQAEVGKFRIELANVYGIVPSLDGDFEGGPATHIGIGTVEADQPSVVTLTPPFQPFQIFAKPLGDQTLENNEIVEEILTRNGVEEKADTEFAGVPARIFDYSELFDIREMVFINNRILYRLTMVQDNQSHSEILKAAEAGWTFLE